MELKNIPFAITDWSKVETTKHKGETGEALWKTIDLACVRVRMVQYSPGYKADHWCKRGHILLVLEGELITQLDDGRIFTLTAGMSYQVQHDGESHSSKTTIGAKLFVVD
jgi:quercetin dioxygenase-like cupin family protein